MKAIVFIHFSLHRGVWLMRKMRQRSLQQGNSLSTPPLSHPSHRSLVPPSRSNASTPVVPDSSDCKSRQAVLRPSMGPSKSLLAPVMQSSTPYVCESRCSADRSRATLGSTDLSYPGARLLRSHGVRVIRRPTLMQRRQAQFLRSTHSCLAQEVAAKAIADGLCARSHCPVMVPKQQLEAKSLFC